MTIFLCMACGTSYPAAEGPPDRCAICEDERQYVPATGQAWISREALAETHRNAWTQPEPGLLSLQTVPAFAINQRAFLVMTPAGNVLWDCIALLDPATEALVRGLGGLAAIAISHPHYYTVMQDWAAAFEAPIHLHAPDEDWVMRPSRSLRVWDGPTLALLPGVTLVHVGGHFPGSTVLHWAAGAEGAGVLLSGDTLQVTPGGRRVSFMWSYPNLMPLPAAAVRRIAEVLAPWPYDRIYGAFSGQDLLRGGPAIVARSAARYAEVLEGADRGRSHHQH
jgi:glyoxylase-like metal-dependent hydrolase (beta-lactamase superfamily II)